MNRWSGTLAAASLVGTLLAGCQVPNANPFDTGVDVESGAATAEKYKPQVRPNASGLRASVMVSAFRTGDEARQSSQMEIIDARGNKQVIRWGTQEQQAVGAALADQLQAMLFESGYFIVNVREETFDSQKSEFELANDGWVTENEVEKGGLVSADLFVKATITEWTPNAGGGGGAAGALTRSFFGGLSWKKSRSRVGLQLQIVNRKQQLVATVPVRIEAKSTSWNAGALSGLTGAIVGGALSQYSNTTMEEAIAVAIKTAVERIVDKVPSDYYSHTL